MSNTLRSPSDKYSGGSGSLWTLSAKDLILDNRGDREKGFLVRFKEANGEMRLESPKPSDCWKENAEAAILLLCKQNLEVLADLMS